MTAPLKDSRGYWFEEPKGKVYETLFGIVRFLRDNQKYRYEMDLRHIRLYGNLNVSGTTAYDYARLNVPNNSDRLTYNLIKSCVDTVNQRVAKNTPKPTFLTSDGDYKKKRKAKKLSRFALGQMYACKYFEIAPLIQRDGGIRGTGHGKVFRVGGKIFLERVLAGEIIVDEAEAIHGAPMNLYQEKQISREVAMRAWPEFADQIKRVKKVDGNTPHHSSLSDMISVVEGWHLATIDEEGTPQGGRRVICFDGVDVLDEEYKRDYFPFIKYVWDEPQVGYFGVGIAEALTGDQVEINTLLRTIQLAFKLCGIPQWWVQTGNAVVKSTMNNEVGRINTFKTTMPVLQTSQPINPLFLNHLWQLVDRAYEKIGISKMSAASTKPAGLDSGKALREFNDIESERQVLTAKAYERMAMEFTRQALDLGKEIAAEMAEQGKDYKVKVFDRKFMESISWKDVDMSEDEYVMQVFPTSALSSTPAGKLSDVQEMAQAGIIPPDYAAELLDFPDLDRFLSMKNAAIEDIERTIEQLTDGYYSAPEPFQWLGTPSGPNGPATGGIAMMQSAYLKYRDDGLEESRLELLRRWMSEAKAMLDDAQAQLMKQQAMAQMAAQAATQPGIQGAAPTAAPEATPTSGLVPNAAESVA